MRGEPAAGPSDWVVWLKAEIDKRAAAADRAGDNATLQHCYAHRSAVAVYVRYRRTHLRFRAEAAEPVTAERRALHRDAMNWFLMADVFLRLIAEGYGARFGSSPRATGPVLTTDSAADDRTC